MVFSTFIKFWQYLKYLFQIEFAKDCVDSWYSGKSKYDFRNPAFNMDTGLFTQIVWRSTSQVGFGISSRNNKAYCVAHYWPRGNVVGHFAENVFPSV
jgi:hypothetical protein